MLLRKLFGRPTLFDDRIPRVSSIFYPVLMMAAGYKSIVSYDWMLFGVTLFALGALLALAIIVAIGWQGPIEYWRQIERTIEVMLKIKDPNVWYSMGYKKVPDYVQVEERKENGGFLEVFKHKLPVTPAVMNTIANAVLYNKDKSFTEARYAATVPNFRKVLKQMKKDGYIAQESSHPKARHIFTKKGMELVYQYADENIKLQLKKEKDGQSYQE